MGQRLNIEIRRKADKKVLANCYYHWSAYTNSSLELANIIGNNYYEIISNKNVSDRVKAIQLLQTTGAGVLQKEYDLLDNEEKKYCSVAINRNLGLISFTDDSIEETRKWEEGRITIDIDFNTDEKTSLHKHLFGNEKDLICYDFEVYYTTDKEEVKLDYEDEIKNGELDLNNIVEFNFKLDNMSRSDISYFLNSIEELEKNCGLFKLENDDLLYHIIY